MSGNYRRLVLFVMVLGSLSASRAQTAEPERGTVHDSVKVGDSPAETYALYLPKGHEPAVPAPIVFIFDPAARGRFAVDFFIPAAEQYGYILVCSNHTRNGPYEQNFEIANRLFTEVLSRFQIDPKRIYTAGFSGGSRLASSIAILTKQIQGVVACGAGMASSPVYFQMSELDDFSFAGIVGNVDMNYREMVNTRNWLNRLKVSNELFEYDYGHRWPPPEDLLEAFDWLQLEAYRKKIVPVDTQQVLASYSKALQKARELEASGEPLRAYGTYDRVLSSYRPYVGLDSVANRQKQLAGSKPYKEARKAWEASQVMEDTLVSRYSARLYRDIALHTPGVQAWWEREIGKLEQKQLKADPERRRMFRRVLNNISAMAYSRGTEDGMATTVAEKAFCFDLCIRVQPEAPMGYLLQVENYIRGNDFDTALDYLERLLETGYSNYAFIRRYTPLDPVRGMARYKALMSE